MPNDLSAALADLAKAAVTALTLALIVFVIPWLRTQLGAQRLSMAKIVAESAVRAVEQTMTDDDSDGDKRDQAIAYAKQITEKRGLHLDDAAWGTLIESAVHDLRLVWKAVDAPPLPALTPQSPKPAAAAAAPRPARSKRAPAKEAASS